MVYGGSLKGTINDGAATLHFRMFERTESVRRNQLNSINTGVYKENRRFLDCRVFVCFALLCFARFQLVLFFLAFSRLSNLSIQFLLDQILT